MPPKQGWCIPAHVRYRGTCTLRPAEATGDATPLEKLGVGLGVQKLTAAHIKHFESCVPLMQRRAAQLDVVDTEGMIREIRRAIEELSPSGKVPRRMGQKSRLLSPMGTRALAGLGRR